MDYYSAELRKMSILIGAITTINEKPCDCIYNYYVSKACDLLVQ